MLRIGVSLLALLACLAAHPFAQQAEPAAKGQARASKATMVVNINTASAAELDQLPGVGPAVAARIVDYRTKKGPFRKLEELMNVQGIGEKSFLKLRSQLTIAGSAAPAAQQQ